MDVNNEGDILIGHAGGVVLYNKHGDVKKLVKFKQDDLHLYLFKWYDNTLLYLGPLGMGKEVRIFKVKL